MANTNIKKEGKKFSNTYQPKHNGRKKKLYTNIKNEYNIGLEEYKNILMYIIQSTETELRQLEEDPSTPFWILNLCKALNKDIEKGSIYTLQLIIERLFGKIGDKTQEPKQPVKAKDLHLLIDEYTKLPGEEDDEY
jgi:hypothetical protein